MSVASQKHISKQFGRHRAVPDVGFLIYISLASCRSRLPTKVDANHGYTSLDTYRRYPPSHLHCLPPACSQPTLEHGRSVGIQRPVCFGTGCRGYSRSPLPSSAMRTHRRDQARLE